MNNPVPVDFVIQDGHRFRNNFSDFDRLFGSVRR